MAIRMTGLASGMDTEGIIKELMSAKSLKKTKLENSKTKLEWKQEKWSDLNTKLYKLYTEQVSKIRLQSTYNAKKASSSDETKASVKANSTVANGSYQLQINKIATTQYFTGGVIDDSGIKGGIQTTTKLADIDGSLVGQELVFTNGDKKVGFQIRSNSTIQDLVSAASEAGLNASFDTSQKRFFISSKDSGADNIFTMTTTALSSDELAFRSDVEAVVDYNNLNSANKSLVNGVYQSLQTAYEKYKTENADKSDAELVEGFKETTDYKSAVETLADVAYTQKNATINAGATNAIKAALYTENIEAVGKEVAETYYDEDEAGNRTVKEDYSKKFGANYDLLTDEEKTDLGQTKEEYIEAQTKKLYDEAVDKATLSKVNSLISSDADTKTRIAAFETSGLDSLDGFSDELIEKFSLKTFDSKNAVTKQDYLNTMDNFATDYLAIGTHSTISTGSLVKLGLADVSVDATGKAVAAGGPSDLALISGSDSEVVLNGATLTSKTSSLAVNGLSIDLKGTTAPGETINFSVSNDTSGVYDMVKGFVKEYNAIMKEMYTLYNAASARGYDVLSSEEKEAMSDDEVELWNNKIKGSLLRNDSILSGIMSSMRAALQTTAEVDGKRYSLASFGIMTSTDYREGGQLHIYGDTEDAVYGDYEDKLKKALETDPELVSEVLSKIGKSLYDTMADKMKASKVSSALTFYNDKQIKSDLVDYTEQIDEWTERLEDMEDNYYSQFSAMEKAMAQLNSQSSYLGNLFGN